MSQTPMRLAAHLPRPTTGATRWLWLLMLTTLACAHARSRTPFARQPLPPHSYRLTNSAESIAERGPYASFTEEVSASAIEENVLSILTLLRERPADVELRVALAQTLLDGGFLSLAVAPLRDAFLMQPGRVGTAALLARVLLENGGASEALALAERLVEEDPRQAQRWIFLAEVRRRQGDSEGAITAASHALLLGAPGAEAKAVIGCAHADAGRLALARRILTEIADESGVEQASIHYVLGRIAVIEERWNDALAHFNRALKIEPNLVVARNDRGVVWARLKNYAAARQDFATAASATPAFGEAVLNLAQILIDEGRRAEASAAVAEAARFSVDPYAYAVAAGRFYALSVSSPVGREKALWFLQKALQLAAPLEKPALEQAIAKIEALPKPKPQVSHPDPSPPPRSQPATMAPEAPSLKPFRPSVD